MPEISTVESQCQWGPLICTPLCLLFGMAALNTKENMPPTSIETLGALAAQMYEKTRAKTLLNITSVDDVLQVYPEYAKRLDIVPVGGKISSAESVESQHCMSLASLIKYLPIDSACIVTSGGHSTLWLRLDGVYWHYEPFNGMIIRFGEYEKARQSIGEAPNTQEADYDATFFKLIPSNETAEGSAKQEAAGDDK